MLKWIEKGNSTVKSIYQKLLFLLSEKKFDDAYNKYLKRCEIRSYENLLQQFTVGNLANPIKKPVKLNQHEYIISTLDDDCEDGVCKL